MVVGLPTLGLTLAAAVARHLGHKRYVPLGTSRKFWYLEELSVPMSSITTKQEKRLYIDPRMMPLIENRRVALVDDVISSGTSIVAGLSLLAASKIEPVVVGPRCFNRTAGGKGLPLRVSSGPIASGVFSQRRCCEKWKAAGRFDDAQNRCCYGVVIISPLLDFVLAKLRNIVLRLPLTENRRPWRLLRLPPARCHSGVCRPSFCD